MWILALYLRQECSYLLNLADPSVPIQEQLASVGCHDAIGLSAAAAAARQQQQRQQQQPSRKSEKLRYKQLCSRVCTVGVIAKGTRKAALG